VHLQYADPVWHPGFSRAGPADGKLDGDGQRMDAGFRGPNDQEEAGKIKLCLRKPRGCLLHDRRLQLVWLFINIIFWLAVGYACVKVLSVMTFATQGVSTIRIRIMQKLIMVCHCRCGR
jgi:hypothetical protein